MPKIMEIIAKETNGKSYHTYKYSYDSIGVPSIDYDDDPNKVMKWKDSGETSSPITPIDLKSLADKLQVVGEKPLLKYFLDGSRHVFKVDDIAYNKQVFPVVAGQIGIGCCKREDRHTPKNSPILRQVLDVAERGRSLGVILFAAEQFRSAIHDRVTGNCSTHAYGRTNSIEVTKGDYKSIPSVYKTMMTRLKQGEYIIQNPVFRSLLNIKFPKPIYKQFK